MLNQLPIPSQSCGRVKPGFIRWQGSSDVLRQLYSSSDRHLFRKKLSICFCYQSSVWYHTKNLHSACHNVVFSLDKSQLRKNTPCIKGIFTKWRRKKHIEIRHRSTLTSCPRGFYTKFVTVIDFLHERNIKWR